MYYGFIIYIYCTETLQPVCDFMMPVGNEAAFKSCDWKATSLIYLLIYFQVNSVKRLPEFQRRLAGFYFK